MQRLGELAGALGEKTERVSQREAALKAISAVRELIQDIGLPIRMRDIGVKLGKRENDYICLKGGHMKNMRILASILFVIFGSGLMLFPAFQCFSQVFPDKPITIYCGQAAGGVNDITSRVLAAELQNLLKVPVVVENKVGGGGALAATLLTSKKGDGYTLAIVPSTVLNTRHIMIKLAFDPFKDFTYILSYGIAIGGICVKNDSPFKTLQALIEHAKKNPGTVSYSSSGAGATQQLVVDYLAKQAHVRFKHLPFSGGTPACTALLGGHVDFTAGAGSHRLYVKQGVFLMLAVTNAEKRDPFFPDVPTLKEIGYDDVPPSDLYVVLAPKNLPSGISSKLEREMGKAVHSNNFHKVMENAGTPFDFKDRHQMEKEYTELYQYYSKLVKELDLGTAKK